jgi:hypothetical protein
MSNYYQKMEEKLINSDANKIVQELSSKFNEQLDNTKTLFAYYSSSVENTNNTLELYNEYLAKNKNMETKVKDSTSDILTNDRKTLYETEAHEKLDTWNKVFKWLYGVLVFMVIISLYFTEMDLSLWKKILIGIIVIVYPIIIGYILNTIYQKYKNVKSTLPKNVYNNL